MGICVSSVFHPWLSVFAGFFTMTYCLGIMTRQGLVMASDARTNAGYDQVNVCRKMHLFCQPGKRVFALLTSGGLSLTQSVITLLRRDFDAGAGLAEAGSRYGAARGIGDQSRHGAARGRGGLERDTYELNMIAILG